MVPLSAMVIVMALAEIEESFPEKNIDIYSKKQWQNTSQV